MMTSGTEHFVVMEGNRIALARKTSNEINRVTSLLTSQGMIVTTVHVSDPQPMKMGFTFWQNNVTLTWQADLNDITYRNHLLSCYKQDYYKASSRDEYYKIYEKLGGLVGYSEFASFREKVANAIIGIDEQEKARIESANREKQERREKRELQKQKNLKRFKKALPVLIGLILIIGGGFLVVTKVVYPKYLFNQNYSLYTQAISLLESGKNQEAYDIFTSIADFEDVNSIIESNTNLKEIRYQPGNIIKFGNYKGESVSWIVLDADGSKRLMLAEKAVDTKPYNDMPMLSNNPYDKQGTPKDVPWSKSSIRNWLNTDFLNETFGSEIKEKIVLASIQTLTDYDRNITETTDDYIFLLSDEEAKKYFSSEAKRRSAATPYAISRNITEWTFKDNSSFSPWWLRTVGEYNGYEAMAVCPDGDIFSSYIQNGQISEGNRKENIGVRPALWIDIS